MVYQQDLDTLFQGDSRSPLRRMLRLRGGSQPGREAFATIVIAWVPLALLVTTEGLYDPSGPWKSFWSDFAVHARFLVTAPMLVAADLLVGRRLGRVAHQFWASGVVRAEDNQRFADICALTARLRHARWSWLLAVGLAYTGAFLTFHLLPEALLPAWHYHHGLGSGPYSFGGWWHALISYPLLLMLLIHWLWRVALWAAFLYRVSQLRLRITAGHPDGSGGLGFAGRSVVGFSPVAFALGAMVAGTIANRVVHLGEAPIAHQTLLAAFALFVAILFVAPLLVFVVPLHSSRSRGTWHYGVLARHFGDAFETRWLERSDMEIKALREPDFSALTDLYSIVERVHRMRIVPVRSTNIVVLELAALAPFAPVALMGIPADVVAERLLSILLGGL